MSAPSLTRKSQVGSDFWDLAAMIKGVSSQWERGSISSVAVAEFKRVSRSMTDMTVFSSSNCWCWVERSVITLCDRKGPNKTNIARISGRNLSQDHLWVLRIQSLLCLKVWYFACEWLPTRVYYLWYILIAVLLTFLTLVKSKTETSQSSKRFQQLTRETTDKTAVHSKPEKFNVDCIFKYPKQPVFSSSAASAAEHQHPSLVATCRDPANHDWPPSAKRCIQTGQSWAGDQEAWQNRGHKRILARRVEALTQLPRLNRSGTTLIICIHLWRLRWK